MASVAALALLLSVSACGGDDDKADPKPTKTTASASPTAQAQPKGAHGVTYEIQNWDQYADDAAVLAWKTAFETLTGSINAHKVQPGMAKQVSTKVLRQFVAGVNAAKKNRWNVKPVGKVKVDRARSTGSQATLTMCLWGTSVGVYEKNGDYVGKPDRFWLKQTATLKLSGGRWILTSFKYKGKCTGGAPA
ncbi:hypothetical protein ASE12_10500 [Aeromicrobium sp. Root236]|nr:hypothetical protein ASE12_10500 [Aeromicrobium sp. Root236]